MGKAILFYVALSAMVMSGIYEDQVRAAAETEAKQARYERRVLAREISHSAFGVAVQRTRDDYESYRDSRDSVNYRDGEFESSSEGPAEGPVLVTSRGRVGSSEYIVTGSLVRSGETNINSLTFDGPISDLDAVGSSYEISGRDTEPGGETGSGEGADASGLRTLLLSSYSTAVSEFDADQVTGLNGDGDIVQGTSAIDFDSLAWRITNHPDVQIYPGGTRWTGSMTFGSSETPAIVIVEGDLTINGNVDGVGALLVQGELSMAGTPSWEGIVLVSSSGGRHELKGTTDIYGALVIRSLTADGESGGEDDAGLPGGHFDVDVFAGPVAVPLYHAHQYDDKYDTATLDLLSSTCWAGGLCWDSLSTAGYTSLQAQFVNPSASSGSFLFETSALSLAGNPADGLSQVFDPSDITSFTVTFDDLCTLGGATTGAVQADTATRGSVFTVQFIDPSTGLSVQEVSAYRHVDTTGCEGAYVDVEPFEFKINGDAKVRYSSTALARISELMPDLEMETVVIDLIDVREGYTSDE